MIELNSFDERFLTNSKLVLNFFIRKNFVNSKACDHLSPSYLYFFSYFSLKERRKKKNLPLSRGGKNQRDTLYVFRKCA